VVELGERSLGVKGALSCRHCFEMAGEGKIGEFSNLAWGKEGRGLTTGRVSGSKREGGEAI